MTLYVLKHDNNEISIMNLIDESSSMEKQLQKSNRFNSVISYEKITQNILPNYREFRNAWEFDSINKKINENPDKCRAIIRKKRDSNLLILDKKAYAESRKPNGDITVINKEAQRLRDIPQKSNFSSNDITVLKSILHDTTLSV